MGLANEEARGGAGGSRWDLAALRPAHTDEQVSEVAGTKGSLDPRYTGSSPRPRHTTSHDTRAQAGREGETAGAVGEGS